MTLSRGAIPRLAAALGLAAALLAGCASQPGASADPALQQKVTDQEARIAALEGKVNALQSAVQTAVAQSAPKPTATRAPTPAPLPAVTGLAVSGTTKGSPNAKVTITDYSDYL